MSRPLGPALSPDEYVDAMAQVAERDAIAQRLSERLARTPAPGGPATPPPV